MDPKLLEIARSGKVDEPNRIKTKTQKPSQHQPQKATQPFTSPPGLDAPNSLQPSATSAHLFCWCRTLEATLHSMLQQEPGIRLLLRS
ncbi:hypothetical protein AAC387_Pa07g1570 [Persea americana]